VNLAEPLISQRGAMPHQFGNVVTSDNSSVTVSIATGPGTFTNTSTLTVNAVDGIATFDNLAIKTVGSYTLQVTDGSLTDATSDPFRINAARHRRGH
jgi:hypothetical protein